jgi:hypothetical protein
MQPGSVITDASAAAGRIEPRRDSAHSPALPILGYAIVLALLAWPIVQIANPMLADYPNHLARLHVTDALADSDALARYYALQGGLYPYLPFDLTVAALARIIGLEPAGRVFIVAALTMPTIGTLVLARAVHGRAGLWPAVSALFAYNLLLSWGLITFLFSLGLALMVFAGWIATERWAWPQRLALFAVLSSAIFCSHPFAFSALGLLIGAWEVGRTPTWSRPELGRTTVRLCLAGIQFIPAVLLATLVQQTDVGSSLTRFGSVWDRVTALLSPVLFLVDTGEIVMFGVLAAAFAMALRRGLLVFDRRMTWPVVAVAAASLVMPVFLSGVYLVHVRLPLVLVLLVIASCRPQPLPRRTVVLVAAVFAAVIAVRTATVAERLAAADREIAELRAASAAIEEGARVLPAITSARSDSLPPHNYWHAFAYLTIDRSAFYPLLFSFFNVAVRPEYGPSSAPATSPVPLEELDAPRGATEQARRPSGQRIYWTNWRTDFDYVVLFDFGQPATGLPQELDFVRRGAIFAIYRVVR